MSRQKSGPLERPVKEFHQVGLPAREEGMADGGVDADAPLGEGGLRETGGQHELGDAGVEPREGTVGGDGMGERCPTGLG